MRIAIIFLALMLVLAACSSPQPVFIVVTATPPAQQPAQLSTLTPLPPIVPVTITPLPPIIPATPTITPQALQSSSSQSSSQASSSQPPPPAQPSATPVLVALGVFDQGGGQMDVFMFGPSVANKFLAFRAIVCNPDCKNNRPDGKDVNSVKFTFFKWNAGANQKGAKVYEHSEGAAPYCSFGGNNTCDFINLADKNVKFPGTNNTIDNGDYLFEVHAEGKNGRNWDGNFRFKVQR